MANGSAPARVRFISHQGSGIDKWTTTTEDMTVLQFLASQGITNPRSWKINLNRAPFDPSNDKILEDQDRVTVTPLNIEGNK